MKYTVHSLDTEIEGLETPGPWAVAFRVVARALILRACHEKFYPSAKHYPRINFGNILD